MLASAEVPPPWLPTAEGPIGTKGRPGLQDTAVDPPTGSGKTYPGKMKGTCAVKNNNKKKTPRFRSITFRDYVRKK